MRISSSIVLASLIIGAAIVYTQLRGAAETNNSNDSALIDSETEFATQMLVSETDRARETVKMLDDIYKGGIVTITDKYVTEDSEIPAGTAFKQIFAIAKDKGWHEVRLLDVTGDPYSLSNTAQDDFEKRAVARIAAGEQFYEEIEESGAQKYFRAMTAIPVALQKCTWCHANYEDVPEGQAIGALGYRLKLEIKAKQD